MRSCRCGRPIGDRACDCRIAEQGWPRAGRNQHHTAPSQTARARPRLVRGGEITLPSRPRRAWHAQRDGVVGALPEECARSVTAWWRLPRSAVRATAMRSHCALRNRSSHGSDRQARATGHRGDRHAQSPRLAQRGQPRAARAAHRHAEPGERGRRRACAGDRRRGRARLLLGPGPERDRAATPSTTSTSGSTRQHAMYQAVRDLDKPCVVAWNGVAAGAGYQIGLCADLRVGYPELKLGQPEIKAGLASIVGSYLMTLHLGLSLNQQLSVTGELISGQRAYDVGLINYLVPREEVAAEGAVRRAGSDQARRDRAATDQAALPRAVPARLRRRARGRQEDPEGGLRERRAAGRHAAVLRGSLGQEKLEALTAKAATQTAGTQRTPSETPEPHEPREDTEDSTRGRKPRRSLALGRVAKDRAAGRVSSCPSVSLCGRLRFLCVLCAWRCIAWLRA